ncbi:hypothetical protein D9M72_395050 [compost metagenome]
MRLRQPDVQRQDAGLGAESEQREQETGGGPERRQRLGAHVGKRIVAGIGLQHAKAQQNRNRPDARHRDVEIAGGAHFGDAVVGGHQEE